VCLISIAFKEQKERAQGFSGQHPEEVEVGEATVSPCQQEAHWCVDHTYQQCQET
jgi:hypothetical protein